MNAEALLHWKLPNLQHVHLGTFANSQLVCPNIVFRLLLQTDDSISYLSQMAPHIRVQYLLQT
jgi:hypothetical protein